MIRTGQRLSHLEIWDLVSVACTCIAWSELWRRYRVQRYGEDWKLKIASSENISVLRFRGILSPEVVKENYLTVASFFPSFAFSRRQAESPEGMQLLFRKFLEFLAAHGAPDADTRFPLAMFCHTGESLGHMHRHQLRNNAPYSDLATLVHLLTEKDVQGGFYLVPIGVKYCMHCLLPLHANSTEECALKYHPGKEIDLLEALNGSTPREGWIWELHRKELKAAGKGTYKRSVMSCCGQMAWPHSRRNSEGCSNRNHAVSNGKNSHLLMMDVRTSRAGVVSRIEGVQVDMMKPLAKEPDALVQPLDLLPRANAKK